MDLTLELISFELCPFVQRSVILLKEKSVPFKTTYIDLADKPAWFLEISPLGKVPVLKAGDSVLFESMVIAEYLEETHLPSLHPKDPLTKAKNRAWAEFSSSLFMDFFQMGNAPTQAGFEEKSQQIQTKLKQLEQELTDGPFFNGDKAMVVDFCIAPLFQRLGLLKKASTLDLLVGLPKVSRWSDSLLGLSSVAESVPDRFEDKLLAYLKALPSHLASLI